MRKLGCVYVVGQTMKLNETTANRIFQYFLIGLRFVPVKAKIAYFYEEERLLRKGVDKISQVRG